MGVFAFVIRTRGGVVVAAAVWFILGRFSRNRDNSPALNFYFSPPLTLLIRSVPRRGTRSFAYVNAIRFRFDTIRSRRSTRFFDASASSTIDGLIAPSGAFLRLLLDRSLDSMEPVKWAPLAIRINGIAGLLTLWLWTWILNFVRFYFEWIGTGEIQRFFIYFMMEIVLEIGIVRRISSVVILYILRIKIERN